MRVLIKLRAEREQEVVTEYHKIQGFVYNMLREKFPELHNKKGYKFFCFSNIFPYGSGKMREGEIKNFIISSPSQKIIDTIVEFLSKNEGKTVNIGENLFSIKSWKVFNVSLPTKNVRISTATPIIIRIPERMYEAYGIPKEKRKKSYVYWRPEYSFKAFAKQLSENLIKKFNDFYGTKIQDYNLFEHFIFKKSVNLRLVIEGKSYGASGSLWDFHWSYMDPVQRKIIEFGLDAGFGERNSFGFGFVNLK